MLKKELKKILPLLTLGGLCGAIIGGASFIYVITLSAILFSLGAFSVLKNYKVFHKFSFISFMVAYIIFMMMTFSKFFGLGISNDWWYLFDGLMGAFAYFVSYSKSKSEWRD